MRIAAAAAACLLIGLTACNRGERRETAGEAAGSAAPAAPIGFQHEPGFDAQGFYKPDQAIGPGALKLAVVAVGAPSDFEAWEGGKRDEVYGPVLMIFEDPASALDDNGKHTARIEVRPVAYMLTPGRLAFHGKDDKLGEIDFEGAFDTAALAGTKAGGAETKPVLSGQLVLAGQKPTALKFSYQSGD